MITQHKELKIYWWYKLQSREPEFLSLLVPCIFPDSKSKIHDVSLTHGYFFIFYREWLHLNLGQFCYLLSFLFELFQKIKFRSMPPMEFYTNYTQRPRTSQSVNNGNDSQRRSFPLKLEKSLEQGLNFLQRNKLTFYGRSMDRV
jgi:hypothetical protein